MLNLNDLISEIRNSEKTLFILCGFPYSGKSYVASEIKSQTNIQIVSIDDIFKRKGFDWNTNVLPNTSEWLSIFDESYKQVTSALKEGKPILYDSTNQTIASRDILRMIATEAGALTKVIYIKTSSETVWDRWEENLKNRNRAIVSRELVEETINMFEEPTEAERVIVVNN